MFFDQGWEAVAHESLSEKSFWHKIKGSSKVIGCKGLCMAFQLFYALDNPNLPKWARVKVIGALAYLISLIDFMPDLTPGVGYVDDVAVMAAALATVAVYIDANVKRRARNQVKKIFKDCDC